MKVYRGFAVTINDETGKAKHVYLIDEITRRPVLYSLEEVMFDDIQGFLQGLTSAGEFEDHTAEPARGRGGAG